VIATDARTLTDPALTIHAADGSTAAVNILGPAGSPVAAVPEPASVLLVEAGVTSLAGLVRRGLRR
jgi:hypothetical protein